MAADTFPVRQLHVLLDPYNCTHKCAPLTNLCRFVVFMWHVCRIWAPLGCYRPETPVWVQMAWRELYSWDVLDAHCSVNLRTTVKCNTDVTTGSQSTHNILEFLWSCFNAITESSYSYLSFHYLLVSSGGCLQTHLPICPSAYLRGTTAKIFCSYTSIFPGRLFFKGLSYLVPILT